MLKYYVNLLILILLTSPVLSQKYEFPPVKYVSLVEGLDNYYLYANGGFHADWYVGYNNAWIVKLPPVDKTGYKEAYIGVKLGRAKNKSYPDSYDLNPIYSKIFVSISNSPYFKSDNYVITTTDEIPMEPLENESLKWIDSSKWFWVKIPLNKISEKENNYIAVWAQSKELTSSLKAPIIAAAKFNDGEKNVWVNHSIKGALPPNENILEMPVSGIKPAIVLKLIPENDYQVIIKNFRKKETEDSFIFDFVAIGGNITKAWLEISIDRIEWRKFSRYIYNSPFFITVNKNDFPKDIFYIRACASDIYENKGCSNFTSVNLVENN